MTRIEVIVKSLDEVFKFASACEKRPAGFPIYAAFQQSLDLIGKSI